MTIDMPEEQGADSQRIVLLRKIFGEREGRYEVLRDEYVCHQLPFEAEKAPIVADDCSVGGRRFLSSNNFDIPEKCIKYSCNQKYQKDAI